MEKFPKKLEIFRRVTSSGNYLPEIDGLRFIAIFLVLLSHVSTFFVDRDRIDFNPNYLEAVLFNGVWGVSLFFIISGFVIGLQFTKNNKLSSSQLKKYFLRRLIRLEPPYIVALLIFFFLYIYVVKKYSFFELLPHLIASAFYLHDIIYQKHSFVFTAAWSLEVEIQLYILAPLLSLLVFIRNKWLDVFLLLLCFTAYQLFYNNYYNVYILFSFGDFLFGMLMAKHFAHRKFHLKNYWLNSITGVISFIAFIIIPYHVPVFLILIKQMFLFLFFFLSLQNGILKKVLSKNLFTLIGGMCYSIYLIHYIPLVSIGNILMRYFNMHNYYKNLLMGLIILIPAIIICGSIFYLLIEKPCMQYGRYKKTFSLKTESFK